MPPNLTQSIEDYLKAIYELTRDEGRASTTEMADFLEVTPASVTGMIKKLSKTDPPLVEYQKHQGVTLTEDGLKIALETIRHHRLLELFLYQILDYPWDEVDEEAHQLEHVISEKFEEKIAKALGYPEYDPHGDPIPSKDLTLPHTSSTSLGDLRGGQKALITRVRDTDSELLRYLSERGIVPGSEVSIKDYSEFDGNIHLQLKGKPDTIVLGPRITKQIFVELQE
ncbi:MAG: metal-dependent transcriptional regulator [Anaerolineales bacterium]|jgi:DtxR family Mn-dependent transcriptional regulator